MSSTAYRALCQIRTSNSHVVAQVPSPVQLLGQRLVLWRDAEQQWRCFADACPHRLAPLSGVTSEKSLLPPVRSMYALHAMPFPIQEPHSTGRASTAVHCKPRKGMMSDCQALRSGLQAKIPQQEIPMVSTEVLTQQMCMYAYDYLVLQVTCYK